MKTGQSPSYLLEELILVLVQSIETSPRNRHCWVFWIEWRGWTPQGSTAIWISSELSVLWSNMTHWSWFSFVSDYFPGSSCIMKVVGVCHCRLSTITLTSDIFSAICNPLLSVYNWELLLSLLWILWVPQSLVWVHLTSTWWFSAYTCPVSLESFGKVKFLQGNIQTIDY